MARSVALIILLPWFTLAQALPAAYRQAAERYRVPPELLWAVAQTESGARLNTQRQPWPWTLNIKGTGYRYASREQACRALLAAARSTSLKRIDVGLGQINLGWQRDYFTSPCDALHPYRNLALTARLLRQRYDERPGSWLNAAARYHRPAGGAPATRYRRQVSQALQQLARTP
ncbi:Soluble lytic murein transglycosylase-related regulatory protein (some contain LysM/invasin domains) [Salmonella enterica subsp. salamae]|uniref:Soluble lytic murein transglycosylase-related regulatory protein (Some contain LysM/invasin domains) n=1 Tax=Salmonella enterica TaxID=28901 RepID=A0A379QT67_SALER|nr:transglycosylase [Salmonella enterica]ECC9552457.1 transglycosylase [Salmonella enterica subsp. salamae]EBT7486446.1 lytic transglycosylase domain-containing protein [Salmonella enterica]EDV1416383.1 lytic transglycosylase domain-containing protein [Salmonella enterica subsp. salamae]SUF67500.1 Soluble lytic murein transglycosylase-related regulatory protein (some contain LysM/invasin domains) [Salmonella enterica]